MPANLLVRAAKRLAIRRPSPTVRSHLPEAPLARPPLLFVHGAMHGAWSWEEHWIPEAVARGWACHAIDFSAGGQASDDGSAWRLWTLAECRADLEEAMAGLDEPPVLIGHSTGALLVQHALAENPARAGVLVAPIPPYGGYKFPLHLLRRHPTDLLRAGTLRPLPPRRDYFFADRLDDAAAQRHLARFDPASVRSQFEIGLPRRAPEINVPLLVLGAEDDALIDPVDVVRTAKAYGTTARMFRGIGHSLMLDAGWRAPLEVMLHWLDEVASS